MTNPLKKWFTTLIPDTYDSDSDSDSRDSARKRPQLNSPGKRTIASSSGSDVALHEGAELSPDDNTGMSQV